MILLSTLAAMNAPFGGLKVMLVTGEFYQFPLVTGERKLLRDQREFIEETECFGSNKCVRLVMQYRPSAFRGNTSSVKTNSDTV